MNFLSSKQANIFSLIANAVFSLYVAALMIYPIGYGLDTGRSFGVGRFTTEEGWAIMSDLADGSETDARLAMSILVNFRINLAAWYAVLAVSLYGFLVDYHERATVHFLGFIVNADTGLLHLYHMGMFGTRWDERLVPKEDPYHRIPVVSDWVVSILNLLAFLLVVGAVKKGNIDKKD